MKSKNNGILLISKNLSFYISILVLSFGIVLMLGITTRSSVIVVKKRLINLPNKIGRWIGRDVPMEERIITELDTDIFINRVYSIKGKHPFFLNLYIGYYGTKKGGRTGHNPYACLPSQGWALLDDKRVKIPIKDKPHIKNITINRLTSKTKEGNFKIVYHWYQSNGDKVLTNGIHQNIQRFWSRILFNRNDGAFIQVSAGQVKGFWNTDKIMIEFIQELYPILASYWPIEKEV